MILSFSTKDKKGKPTNFVGKIWASLISGNFEFNNDELNLPGKCQKKGLLNNDIAITGEIPIFYKEKKHTIREDKHNRWHAGVLIHFIVFPRSKKMFQFAPVIPCQLTQRIDIYETGDGTEIFIDGRCLDENEAELLAKNDGFEDAEDMLNWFNGGIEDWKIIHWTDLKY